VKVKQFDVYKTICKVDVLLVGGAKGFGVGLYVLLWLIFAGSCGGSCEAEFLATGIHQRPLQVQR
jgi:hypothetical protein